MADIPPSDNYIPAPQVYKKRYRKCEKTLDRWLKDEKLGFPRPIYIRGRRYFREAELVEWERAQASKPRIAALAETNGTSSDPSSSIR
jgi:predicted DNA-binding transcriptional regulator AlpA